jgi:20S proteasome alpha/beta subunit
VSIAVVVKGRDGIVLAADSRRSIIPAPMLAALNGDVGPEDRYEYITYDGATKVFSFADPHRFVGVAVVGDWGPVYPEPAPIGAEIEAELPAVRLRIEEYARLVSGVLVKRFAESTAPSQFNAMVVIAGYDEGENTGHVFAVHVPKSPTPVEHHVGALGITYGGKREVIDRLLGAANGDEGTLALDRMTLPECVELAAVLAWLPAAVQHFVGPYGLTTTGGPVDLAAVTARDGLSWVSRKEPKPLTDDSAVTRRPFVVGCPVPSLDAPEDQALGATYTVAPAPATPDSNKEASHETADLRYTYREHD